MAESSEKYDLILRYVKNEDLKLIHGQIMNKHWKLMPISLAEAKALVQLMKALSPQKSFAITWSPQDYDQEIIEVPGFTPIQFEERANVSYGPLYFKFLDSKTDIEKDFQEIWNHSLVKIYPAEDEKTSFQFLCDLENKDMDDNLKEYKDLIHKTGSDNPSIGTILSIFGRAAKQGFKNLAEVIKNPQNFTVFHNEKSVNLAKTLGTFFYSGGHDSNIYFSFFLSTPSAISIIEKTFKDNGFSLELKEEKDSIA